MSAIGGVLVGIVLFLVAFPLLFWNEGRAVQTAQSLEEGASNVVTVGADKVEPGNEGKLVHLTGNAATKESLTDPPVWGVGQCDPLAPQRRNAAVEGRFRDQKGQEVRRQGSDGDGLHLHRSLVG